MNKILVTLCLLFFARPSTALTVSAVGDIMMGTDYPDGSQVVETDFFEKVRPFMSGSDLRFGNFEGTLYDGPQNPDGKPSGANRYIFRTPTAMVAHLNGAGFNVVSLANNHSHDFGKIGLASTKATLAKAGVKFSSKDGEVAHFSLHGQSVALIATDFYPGRRSVTTPAATYAEIHALKRQGHLVIVSAHVGGEGFGAEHVSNHTEIYLGENRGNSVAFAHAAIEAGADLILMSGPHVPRGLEVHNGRLIAYSLGNFLTEKGISISGNAGLAPLLEVELENSGEFRSGRITSFEQQHGRPLEIDPQMRAFKLIEALSSEDFPATQPRFFTGSNGDGEIAPNVEPSPGLRRP